MNKDNFSPPETVQANDIHTIARVSHEAIRAYKQALGEDPVPSWEDAPEWMRESSIEAVQSRMENPGAPPSAQHEAWMNQKEKTGWRYGPTKDPAQKTHPMMVPYGELPETERYKDVLIQAVVDALSGPVD